ncbi:MAG: N-acetyltransferase [Alphaproteobacteria bacterium]|nr:MAG: N-acetyltransferase [Alphaproteobacteria bacterium]
MTDPIATMIASGQSTHIRKVEADDLAAISHHEYTVSIDEPQGDLGRLTELFAEAGFWREESGAVAIVETASGRLVGTAQFYRPGPCIHGLEIGYIIHREDDRGKSYASQAARLLSDHLFEARPQFHRHQLTIDVDNVASWYVAEHCGFQREGILRSAGFDPDNPSDDYIYSRIRGDI